MKYTLEKCDGHVCVKDKNGKELSKWSNKVVTELGGLDKIVERAKKAFPNLEVTVTEEAPAPTPAPEPSPAPGN